MTKTDDQERFAASWIGHADDERRNKERDGTDEEYRMYIANQLRHIRAEVSKPWWKRLLGL